ncbi:MFS transporter [Salinisphaera sp. RV14]|uniref:MFS transporter n=1 Tax=Salinisphaera sp. RV14 TaxID=3454140 RepID=UPI003F84244F
MTEPGIDADSGGGPEQRTTGQHWRWTIMASMADYIDAGSIVAGGAGLSMWANAFHLTHTTVGFLGAISSNAISAGIGGLIGGWLGDRLGRKRVYQYDLLLYAFGGLWLVFAMNLPMLAIGYFLVGIAVGADLPTSWSLIAEFAPHQARRKLVGMTNLFWYIGPVVTLCLALVLSPLGLLGIRILFAHLVIVALVTWYFRRGMVESERWEAARASDDVDDERASVFQLGRLKSLFSGANARALAFLFVVFTFWQIAAGTYGFFFPYILRSLGNTSQVASVAVEGAWFISAMLSLGIIFIPFGDRINRRLMFGTGAALQVIAFVLLLVFPISNSWVVISNVVLFGVGQGVAQWPFVRVWASELFPTMLRSTAQGFNFGVMRIIVGVWSLFVPMIAAGGITVLASILATVLAISGVVGTIFAPDTGGRSLEAIEAERADRAGG